MSILDPEKCEICGGSGKRTDPLDGTVWPDEVCPACRSYLFEPGTRVKHIAAPELGVGIVQENELCTDHSTGEDYYPEGTLVRWPAGGSGWYVGPVLVAVPKELADKKDETLDAR